MFAAAIDQSSDGASVNHVEAAALQRETPVGKVSGTTVIWTNRDDIPHTVVSTEGVFRSKVLDTDEKFSYTFAKAGTFPYFCSIHPKMTGKSGGAVSGCGPRRLGWHYHSHNQLRIASFAIIVVGCQNTRTIAFRELWTY